MSKYAKVALASLKAIRKELEDQISDALKELGFSFESCEDDASAEELIERKREKILAKVNRYFDNLRAELSDTNGICSSSDSKGGHDAKTESALAEIAISIKELKHQIGNIQNDVNELKANHS
ncbi:MAG: hypothetical protein SFT81_00655 [Candidatus Caenarcaniphilales bacterium]|nr:hypothetical protein [Candidatus Caenarcaniphilales bacterium]